MRDDSCRNLINMLHPVSDMGEHDLAAIAELQQKVERLRNRPCAICGRMTCGHEALIVIASGSPRQPYCVSCLADVLSRTPTELRDHLFQHFQRRDCYGTVWREENQREHFAEQAYPGCLWPSGGTAPASPTSTAAEMSVEAELTPAAQWNAGELACGDLVLELRSRLRELPGGTLFHLVAQDSGAREDIPAWCRLTGHRLVKGQHPDYWIQRKEM